METIPMETIPMETGSTTSAPSRGLQLASARARQRAQSAGSVMFIVATTLALLAMMGLFAMTSATREVRVSGFIRQSTQAHVLSQATIQASSAYLNPKYAGLLVHDYATGRVAGATTTCLSAAPTGIPNVSTDQLAASCLRVMDLDMKPKLAGVELSSDSLNSVDPTVRTGFKTLATQTGFEITYPHQQQVPGTAANQNLHYYRTTVTTFAQVTAGQPPFAAWDLQKTEMGRGHLVVGPFQD
jgi:Tfp pilus assembly protein PilX